MAWGALACVLGLVWLLQAEGTASPYRFLAKPIASSGFIAVALAGGALDTGVGRLMLAALVASALGDLFLMGTARAAFLAGLGSFLVAHLLFGAGFWVRGIALAGLVSLPPLGVFGAGVLRWLRPHLPAPMAGPVTAYAVVISLMGMLAVSTALATWDWRIPVGAAMFIVSDLAVARQTFVAPGFGNRLWGLPLYYGAQLLLAWAAGG